MRNVIDSKLHVDHGLPAMTERYTYCAPRVEIREAEDRFWVAAEMPGVARDGLSVRIENGHLVVEGRMVANETGQVLLAEIPRRHYYRRFRLGPALDVDRIEARCENGILHVSIAKSEQSKARLIDITFNQN